MRSTTVPGPSTQIAPGLKMPEGTRWSLNSPPSLTTVWPALLPPWNRMTRSASCARRSVIFPLPSSPHCAPTIAVTGTCSDAKGLRGPAEEAAHQLDAELRKLDERARARRLPRPPKGPVPLAVARGVIAERDAGAGDLAVEQHRRAPLVIWARHEDGAVDAVSTEEVGDTRRVLLRGGRGWLDQNAVGRDAQAHGLALHELGGGRRRWIDRRAGEHDDRGDSLLPQLDGRCRPGALVA